MGNELRNQPAQPYSMNNQFVTLITKLPINNLLISKLKHLCFVFHIYDIPIIWFLDPMATLGNTHFEDTQVCWEPMNMIHKGGSAYTSHKGTINPV